MASTYAVSAELAVIDRASPAMAKILGMARDLAAEFDKVKASTKGLFSDTGAARFNTQLGSINPTLDKIAASMKATKDTAVTSFDAMTASVRTLDAQLAATSKQMAQLKAPAVVGGGTGGGGRTTAVAPTGGSGRLVGAGIIGGLAYGVVKQAELEDASAKIMATVGVMPGDANYQSQRTALEQQILGTYSQTGMSLQQIEAAYHNSLRLMGPNLSLLQRSEILGKVLPIAAQESILKGGSIESNANALVELLHQSGYYDPKDINKLIRRFSLRAFTILKPFSAWSTPPAM